MWGLWNLSLRNDRRTAGGGPRILCFSMRSDPGDQDCEKWGGGGRWKVEGGRWKVDGGRWTVDGER